MHEGGDLDPWVYLARVGVRARTAQDAFFVDGDAVCAMRTVTYLTQEDEEELLHPDVTPFYCSAPDCRRDTPFRQLHEFETHYASAHSHACSSCAPKAEGVTLPSAHLLALHVAEAHDAYFAVVSERRPSFQCFLEKCNQQFWNPAQRRDHCLTAHQFPADFKYIEGWAPPRASRSPPLRSPAADPNSPRASPERLASSNAVPMVNEDEKPPGGGAHNGRRASLSLRNLGEPASTVMRSKPSKLRRPASLSPVKRPNNLGRPMSVVESTLSPRFEKPLDEAELTRFGFRRHSTEQSSPKANLRRFSLTPSVVKKSFSRTSIVEHGETSEGQSSAARTPLSLAKMGQRLSSSRQSILALGGSSMDVSSTGSSNFSPASSPLSSNANSNLSSQSGSGMGCNSASPNKRVSRIPVFSRSASVKVPASISFGANVERGFETPWYRSREESSSKSHYRNTIHLSQSNFEVEMRDALDF